MWKKTHFMGKSAEQKSDFLDYDYFPFVTK